LFPVILILGVLDVNQAPGVVITTNSGVGGAAAP
jgi:hypothetical protein